MDSSVSQILILLVLLLLSGIFSSAETALTTYNKIRMRALADEGNKRASTVLAVTENSGKMLSAILIGNNIVNTAVASLATTIAYRLGGTAVAIASGLMTLLIILFGEITPKTMATIHAEKMSLFYAPVINIFMKIMTPFIFIVNGLSTGLLMLLRIDPNAKDNTMTEAELRSVVNVSHQDGVIESDEKEMIYNVFDLGDAIAKDVMVPRVNVTFADIDSSYDELIDLFREDKFTRLPVYQETKDNVVGTINMKDLLVYPKDKPFSIRNILREPYFTYEYKATADLMIEMRKASVNLAIVLDEYGATAGLVTLEDLLEEIVGEIRDEYDEDEVEDIKEIQPEREYVVQGSAKLDDINEALHINLESEDYDSIGGYIIEQLDCLPKEGQSVTLESGIRLVVDRLDKNRIELVHIWLPEKKTETEEQP